MISSLHIGSELRRFFRGTLPPLGLAVLIALPLLFGGLFVWSYKDPVSGLSRLPVALVNSDTGATRDGEPLHAGDRVTEQLLDTDQVNFIEVSAEEARDGVADGTYYFALELPDDFSRAAVSVSGDNPRPATINAVYNNANGFLAQVLGNQVTTTVVDTIAAEMGETIADQMLVGFNTIGEGMDQAADGAGRLSAGVGQAHEGATELADGADRLRGEGVLPLADGARKLADSTERLDAGLADARDGAGALAEGLGSLQQGTDRLGAGAAAISGGVDRIAGFTDPLAAGQEQLVAGLVTVSAQLRDSGVPVAVELADRVDALTSQVVGQGTGGGVLGQLQQLRDGAAELHRQLTDPTAEYRAGVDKAAAASAQLATGLHTLADGSSQLVVGARTLADGTSRLVGASDQLTVGAAQLRDGLVELDTGSGELSLRISQGAQQVPHYEDGRVADYAETIATPVTEKQTADTMTLFGVGLAPFFLSLGLFMGATVIFLLLRALQRRALDSGAGPLRVVLASYLPAMLIGWAQAVLMWAVLLGAVRVEVLHPFGLLVAMVGVSTCFVAITQAINALFGPAIGRVLCLVLMSVQLVSSGGLYPVETQPAFQRAFHHVDPMTFTVTLFRQMIVGPGDARVWTSSLVLVGIFLGALAVSSFAAHRSRTLRVKDLHPELAL